MTPPNCLDRRRNTLSPAPTRAIVDGPTTRSSPSSPTQGTGSQRVIPSRSPPREPNSVVAVSKPRPTATAVQPAPCSPRHHSLGRRRWSSRRWSSWRRRWSSWSRRRGNQCTSRGPPSPDRLRGHNPEGTRCDIENFLVVVRTPSAGASRHDQVTTGGPGTFEPHGFETARTGKPTHICLQPTTCHLPLGDDEPNAGRAVVRCRVTTRQRSSDDRCQFFRSALPTKAARFPPLPQDLEHYETSREHARKPALGEGQPAMAAIGWRSPRTENPPEITTVSCARIWVKPRFYNRGLKSHSSSSWRPLLRFQAGGFVLSHRLTAVVLRPEAS